MLETLKALRKMKVLAREARLFLAFWTPGSAENLQNLGKMKVSGTRSAPGFGVLGALLRTVPGSEAGRSCAPE